jgi:EAL domain-containing protein (putative c-di-GMP-specific phosphodiesterase class I)
MIMHQGEHAVDLLHRLKALGVHLSIDDFGTGYSSLAYLKRFPIDELKIDRGFVRDIPADINDMEIAATIIAMARNLKLKVVAEGVETPEQLAFLARQGCHAYQGYLFSPPIAADRFPQAVNPAAAALSGERTD